jgi:membrane fusion protein (multidrug efflux system)
LVLVAASGVAVRPVPGARFHRGRIRTGEAHHATEREQGNDSKQRTTWKDLHDGQTLLRAPSLKELFQRLQDLSRNLMPRGAPASRKKLPPQPRLVCNFPPRSGIVAAVRYLLALAIVLVLGGGLAAIKYKQIASLIAMGAEMEKMGPPPEAVGSVRAKEDIWEDTITAVGSVVAARGVAVTTDAQGIIARIHFDSGATVRAGQVLVELDTTVERAQLASAKARRELAEANLKRTRALFSTGAIPQAQLDADEAQVKTTSTEVDAIEAQIAKKTARAPFGGRIGLRSINLGQFVGPGTTIAVLESVDALYIDFSVPQQHLSDLRVGMTVRFDLSEDGGAPMEGRISAVEPSLDAVTRNVKVRATLPQGPASAAGQLFRAGMFVRVAVVLPGSRRVVVVPQTAVVYASYGNSVFVVEERKTDAGISDPGPDGRPVKLARQRFVRLGEARGDFVEVKDGVVAGDEVVTVGAFKLRNGAPVLVNNTILPNAQMDPRVQER